LRDFDDGAYRAVAAGVSVRIPLLAGVVCCALPELHGSSSKSSKRAASETRFRLKRTPARPRAD
jgi:hypothetical protein